MKLGGIRLRFPKRADSAPPPFHKTKTKYVSGEFLHLFILLYTRNQALRTVGFWWCQTIHKKFSRRFDTIFGLKMMVKSGLEKMAFRVAAAQCKKICPGRLSWPGRLAGISPLNLKIFFPSHFSPPF